MRLAGWIRSALSQWLGVEQALARVLTRVAKIVSSLFPTLCSKEELQKHPSFPVPWMLWWDL